MKTKIDNKVIEEIKNKIVNNFHLLKIILFGSYAGGEQKETSDLDLLITKDTDMPVYKRTREIRLLLSKYIFGKDILVYTPQEIEEWKNVPEAFITTIVNEGLVLYERKN